ncbi:hypothetical protein A0256_20435 [Mucilaginibacter sp. PAMC 26640]|nr:hypothetical protein A0256_20435 [Mucilaginibacter sp. PAMC 26640]
MKKQTLLFIQALLNSYSILFFSQHIMLGALLLVASFFNPVAGLAGLLSVCFSLGLLKASGHQRANMQSGLYSFNSILLGIGFGSFFHVNAAFCIWLVVATTLTVMLTVIATAGLAKRGLPSLSLPFVVVFWLVLAAANGYAQLGLLPKESYLLNELSVKENFSHYQLFNGLNTIPLPLYLKLFFRAISAILFQDSVFAGVVISIGVLIHSRISFSLLVIGFITSCLFNNLTHIYPDGLGHYHLGVNFMMASMALSGFFIVPSLRSYLLVVSVVPLACLFTAAFSGILDAWHLPVLSLPFCLTVLVMLYFLKLRERPGKLQLTAYQNYSPEANLYQYLNGQQRVQDLTYLKLTLPFMGGWTVSQGYYGGITHSDGWAQALDFVITDGDKCTFKYAGDKPEDYYCYNKPVLACADGLVELVINHVADNLVGEMNIIENWGNTIIIKHTDGVYSKVSHLKQYSAKVKPGEVVKRGDILGLCGNSGRSPEPHLHFQVQATPYLGSKTIPYPFAYFKQGEGLNQQFNSFMVPKLNATLSSVDSSSALKHAFTFQPGYTANMISGHKSETWEVFTDSNNQTYFYDYGSGDIAYFVSGDLSFYFTAFYGGRSSLLYQFQLAAYKVIFSTDTAVKINDVYPLNIVGAKFGLWLHDIGSPFHRFIERRYESQSRAKVNEIIVTASGINHKFGQDEKFMKSAIRIEGNRLAGFSIDLNGRRTEASWEC